MTRVAFLAGLLAAVPAWALDLSPTPAFRELEGSRIPVLQFADGARVFTYRPPQDWRWHGGGNVLQFDAPGRGQNLFKLMLVAKPPGTPAEPELSSATVLRIARAVLPSNAENLRPTQETPTPFAMEGRPSLELTFSYALSSTSQMASVAVVDRSETQWFVLSVECDAADFATLRPQVISSMFSWRPSRPAQPSAQGNGPALSQASGRVVR
jgi:hypothetical protein